PTTGAATTSSRSPPSSSASSPASTRQRDAAARSRRASTRRRRGDDQSTRTDAVPSDGQRWLALSSSSAHPLSLFLACSLSLFLTSSLSLPALRPALSRSPRLPPPQRPSSLLPQQPAAPPHPTGPQTSAWPNRVQ